MALADLDLSQDSATPVPYLPLARRFPVGGGVPMTTPLLTNQVANPVSFQSLFATRNTATGNQLTPVTLATPATQPMAAQVKNPALQTQLNTATATRAANAAAGNESISDFVKSFLENRGKVQQATDQETAAIGDIYDPNGLEARLRQFNQQRQAATNTAARSGIARALRSSNIARMQGGNSSYLDRALAQNLANINASAAGQAADLNHADALNLASQRVAGTGRRQALIDAAISRNLMPVEAANRVEGLNLANLGSLTNLDQSNTLYEAPENAVLRRLQLYDELRRRGLAV